MGGYCTKLGIWWQISWSKLGNDIVQGIKSEAIGINLLKIATIVVNYLAVVFTFLTQDQDLCRQLHVHIGNNNTTDAWYKIFLILTRKLVN